jgi:F-box associated protein
MSQRTEIFLPTEIIFQIVTFIAAEDPPSQVCLHACCLVSRQWYSASVGLLYAKPDFQQALTFEKFIATVCPPIAAASKRKTRSRNLGLGLGSLVRTLDMSSLGIHNSTKRVTARLLGRVKENLEVFIAPMVSFS